MRNLNDFLDVLSTDMEHATRVQKSQDNQANRRTFIRTAFASLEGISWLYRNHVVEVLRDLEMLTREEETALDEFQHFVTPDGQITSQRKLFSIPSNIRLATRLASRANTNFTVDFGVLGWEKFNLAVIIRNRVTHPKKAGDLFVSDEDIEDCRAGLFWLVDLVRAGMNASNQALQNELEQLRQFRSELDDKESGSFALYRAIKGSLDDQN